MSLLVRGQSRLSVFDLHRAEVTYTREPLPVCRRRHGDFCVGLGLLPRLSGMPSATMYTEPVGMESKATWKSSSK